MSGPRGAGSGRDAASARTKRCPGRSPARGLLSLLIGLLAALSLPAAAAAQAVVEYPAPPGSNPGGITSADGALWFVGEGTSTIYRMTTGGALTNAFPVPTSSTPSLDQITVGSDGALWFTQPGDNQIGRIDPTTGALTEYNALSGHQPEGITAGPDGAIWYSATGLGKIGRIHPAAPGVVTEHPAVGTAGAGISDITAASDGHLWFTESLGNQIGRIATNGVITHHFAVPTAGSEPSGITEVPGAGLWFTEFAANQIGQITFGGVVTEYPGAGAGPSAIAGGRDGALWFTESTANAIGRITTGGAVTNHFGVPTPGSEPSDVTTGPDGALWFTEFLGDKVGRIETVIPPPPPPPAVIPRIPITIPSPPVRRKPRCKVPKVKGMSVRKAKKKLKKARCKYRVRGRGFVVSTKPKAGKRTTKRVLVKAKPKKARGSGARAVQAASRR